MPSFDCAAFRPLYADSLKDLSSQPPASETAQALKLAPLEDALEVEPESEEGFEPDEHAVSASVATPATATILVRVFMPLFLQVECVDTQ